MPASFRRPLNSSPKERVLWCFSWFLIYRISRSLSCSEWVKAPYPACQPEKSVKIRFFLIQFDEDTLISLIKSDSAWAGCKRIRMCTWSKVPFTRYRWLSLDRITPQIYRNMASLSETTSTGVLSLVEKTMWYKIWVYVDIATTSRSWTPSGSRPPVPL